MDLIILPRKTSKARLKQSVPEIDTDRRGEYPQALEIAVLKELGNLTPYVRNKGSLQIDVTVDLRPQINGPSDCLPKTQDSANS